MRNFVLTLVIAAAFSIQAPVATAAIIAPTLSWNAATPRPLPTFEPMQNAGTRWQPNVGPIDGGTTWNLEDMAAPVAVTSSYSITSAYNFPGGVSTGPGGTGASWTGILSDNPSDESATFEIWFKPADLVGKEILFETGGTTDGATLRLDGSQLRWLVQDGGPNEAAVSLGAFLTGDFIQVVMVYNRNNPGTTDSLSLFINGGQTLATSATTVVGAGNINDFSGTDGSGIGKRAGVAGGDNEVGDAAFNGQIAIFRYYRDMAFTQAQAMQNFEGMGGQVVVPEPATLVVWAGLLGLAFAYRRRF